MRATRRSNSGELQTSRLTKVWLENIENMGEKRQEGKREQEEPQSEFEETPQNKIWGKHKRKDTVEAEAEYLGQCWQTHKNIVRGRENLLMQQNRRP